MKRRLFSTVLLAATLLPAGALAGEVIAHDSIDLTPDEIRDVFLGERQLVGNIKLVPADNSAAQAQFLSRVLQTDGPKYYARWTKKTFREGLPAPAVKGSDAEVIAFVKATPGAIGYVSGTTTGVKVLHKF